MPVAIVSGAGPVGSLTAIFLAQRGFTVKVFDKRELPPRRPPKSDTRAYLLNLNLRAMRAFKLAKIDLVPIASPCNGKLEQKFLNIKGKPFHAMAMPVDTKNPKMVRVFRDEISRHIIDEAKRLHPDSISFEFNSAVQGVSFETQTALVARNDTLKEEKYDLLVGADGANSVVRDKLQNLVSGILVRRVKHSAVYSTGPLESPDNDKELPNNCFLQAHTFSKGAIMLTGRGDGDSRIAIFVTKPDAEKIRKGDIEELLKICDASLPSLPACAREPLRNLIKAGPEFNPISGWTYLTQFHGPRTVLLGDAAHTMTPVLGQGCNSGLEDAQIFAETLDAFGGDIDAALPAFSAERVPDIQALLRLNEVAANERVRMHRLGAVMWHKIWVGSHSLMLIYHNIIHKTLHKLAPKYFDPPMMFQAQLGLKKYRTVFPAMYFDFACLAGISAAIAGISCAAIASRKN